MLSYNKRVPVAYAIPTIGRYTCPEYEVINNRCVRREIRVNANYNFWEKFKNMITFGRPYGANWMDIYHRFLGG